MEAAAFILPGGGAFLNLYRCPATGGDPASLAVISVVRLDRLEEQVKV